MPGLDGMRSLGGLFSRLGAARHAEGERPEAGSRRPSDDFAVINSRALAKFLTHLSNRPAPVLLDLGPVVGSNVSFFGDQLNCKIHIEDLLADVDRHLRDGRMEEFPAFLSKRFVLEDSSVDGVLLWDIYDYLDRPSAQALAKALVRLLCDGGELFGLFGGASRLGTACTKFVVADGSHLRQHAYPSVAVRQSSPPNRDIIKMFEGMSVTDSFLLHDGLREILFRKGAGGRPII